MALQGLWSRPADGRGEAIETGGVACGVRNQPPTQKPPGWCRRRTVPTCQAEHQQVWGGILDGLCRCLGSVVQQHPA